MALHADNAKDAVRTNVPGSDYTIWSMTDRSRALLGSGDGAASVAVVKENQEMR